MYKSFVIAYSDSVSKNRYYSSFWIKYRGNIIGFRKIKILY